MRLRSTIRFDEKAGETQVTLKIFPVNASAQELETFEQQLPNLQKSWEGSFERLIAYLGG